MTGYCPAVSVCLVIEVFSAVYDTSVVVLAFANALHERNQQFLGFVIEVLRDVDMDGDVVITGLSGAPRHALTGPSRPFGAADFSDELVL
jgi:hypothetical protein